MVSLTIDDSATLARDLKTVAQVVPEKTNKLQVKYGSTNAFLRIIGTTANFADVHNFKLEKGEIFTASDDASRRRFAVVGHGVLEKLDTTAESLMGQKIYITGVGFEVIGIFEEKGQTGWRNVDVQVWVPLLTAQSRLFGSKDLEVISAQVAPGISVEQAIVDVERIMRREHKILPGVKNDFSIGDPRTFFNVREATAKIFAYLLAGIASISLIVGGIGIMNIMLVTVTERTREIGIRKALGATRFNILMQFLVEALVLCLLGGMVGIALGAGIATVISNVVGWQTLISPTAVAIAFAFSAGVGLFFGIWPAQKAARLDPIEALRYD
jgi:putative ABC transport system permease protein